jgi:flagellar biosynthesis component FlhA
MNEIQVLEHLSDKLAQRRTELAESLAAGTVSDFPAYRELCGVIRGLLTAQMEIGDLVRILKANHD